jgi:hypothetical protein
MNSGRIRRILNTRTRRFIQLFVATILGCNACDKDLPNPSLAQRAEARCPSSSSSDYYFPNHAVFSSRFLAASSARPLWCGGGELNVYRFLWIPSYRPTLIIEVEHSSGSFNVDAVEFTHPRTGQLYTVQARNHRKVPDADAQSLLRALAKAQFWTTPPYKNPMVDDGAIWIIEGRERYGYRSVIRFNPKETDFIDAGRAFVLLAGKAVPDGM